MEVLRLVPILLAQPAGVMDRLASRLSGVFGVRTERVIAHFDPEVALDPIRGQYNSRLLLAQLLTDTPADSRVIGITGQDLFIPVLTFVFGEAQLDGRAAVVSTFRLDAALYGLPADPGLSFERLCKVAIHELGHTYNLVHCYQSDCVMASSTTVDGVDTTSDDFCPDCRARLRQALASK